MRGSDYVVKRVLFAIGTVFVAVTLNFVLFRSLSGDAVSALRCRTCTQDFKEFQRRELGLDKSKWEQYQIYLVDLAHGRHGPLAPHRGAGHLGPLGADQEHDPDGRARDALRDRVRHRDGRHRRLAARDGDGQGGALGRAQLLLDAAAVARPRDRPLRRGVARVTHGRGQGPDARDPQRPHPRSRSSSTGSST